jgi:hypothetical protein
VDAAEETLNQVIDVAKEILEISDRILAEPAGFNAHDRVEPRIVFVVELEHFDADRVLLQLIGLARERLVDDVAQQFADAASGHETL